MITNLPAHIPLNYSAPYQWPAVLDFLRRRTIAGVEYCADDYYQRTFDVHGQRGLVTVRIDPLTHALTAGISGQTLAADSEPIIDRRLRRLFDLDADMTTIETALAGDPALCRLPGNMVGIRVPGAWDRFELAVRAILGQQVTVAAARTLAGRLCEKFGRTLEPIHPFEPVAGQPPSNRLFPTADALAEADIASIGMPQRRAQCIRALARAVTDGMIVLDGTDDLPTLEKQLLALPGIGRWTVAYLRMRAFNDADAFPPGDVALLKAARAAGIAAGTAELQALAQRWQPWRAYAAMRLWHSLSAAQS